MKTYIQTSATDRYSEGIYEVSSAENGGYIFKLIFMRPSIHAPWESSIQKHGTHYQSIERFSQIRHQAYRKLSREEAFLLLL